MQTKYEHFACLVEQKQKVRGGKGRGVVEGKGDEAEKLGGIEDKRREDA